MEARAPVGAPNRADVISDLLARASVSAPDLLVADVALALRDAGGDHLVMYVVDYDQEALCTVGLASELLGEPPPPLRLEGTMAGRAFQSQEVVSAVIDGTFRVWAPLRERSERIGVLEFGFVEVDDDILQLCEDLGRLVGHLVRTADRYTDVIEMRRRRQAMQLAAEMQWDLLLPPLAFEAPDVSVAGHLEPAYEIGGDGFDYSLNGDLLDVVLLDAMGHGVQAALASALALAGVRHGRRQRRTPEETFVDVDASVDAVFGGEMFITGHIARLDTVSGLLTWVNAGHPDPLLVRGGRVTTELHAEPSLPLGLATPLGLPRTVAEVGRYQLEPGDLLVYYSDGIVEARPQAGDEFGLERLRDRLELHLASHLATAEVLRRIARDVRDYRADSLKDDATMVLVEWRPHREAYQRG